MFKTNTLVLNMSAGDYTLDADDLRDVTTIQITGNLAPRVLTFPQMRKLLQVINLGTAAVTLALGSSTSPMPAGKQAAIFLSGDYISSTSGGTGGGSITFLMLNDTPNSYSGKAGQVVAVKDDESGLEFSAAAAGVYEPGVGLELDGVTFNISDPNLLSLLALSPVANALPYFDTMTSMSLISTTPFGRGLLNETDGGTLLATIGGQPHSDNLDVWAGLLPSAFQPANPNLDLWSAVQPSQFLLGTAIGNTVQAHSDNLDAWSGIDPDTIPTDADLADVLRDADIGVTVQAHDPQLDQWAAIDPATKADASSLLDVLRDSDIGVTVQAHTANLDAWGAIAPTAKVNVSDIGITVQGHSANLDDWSGTPITVLDTFLTDADISDVLRTTDIGSTVQGYSATLAAWAGISPSTKLNVSAIGVTVQGWSSNLDEWSALNPSIFVQDSDIGVSVQAYSTNLDAWSALATSSKISTSAIGVTVQPYNANLANWAAKTVPVGEVVGTTDTQTLTNKVYTDITTTMFATNVIDTDVTLAANANTRLATQRAVKTYADAISVARTYTAGTGLGLSSNQFSITDQELLAFAGLTLTANTLPYATSASAMSTTPLTAFARTLLDDADQAAMKATLGLVIGTNVQAWNALLDTWATKAAPAGTVVGTTDAQTLTNKTIDAAANTFTNIALGMFAAGVIDTDPTLAAASNSRLSTQAAIKAYVDNAVAGLKWKQSVRVATTANITLSGTQTIDGVSVVAGDRVLVKNQTTGSQNGIYLVAAGAWTRTTDADTGPELVGATVTVEDGTLAADTQWTCNNNSITLGTTSIVFIQISGAGTYSAGFGLSLTGNQFSITDQELVAFANLTLSADSLPYATSASTMSTTPLTAFARTLLDDTTQGAMQTTLGLVPGTNVQAYDALLQAFAGLTTVADTMPYFTGVDTVATTALSSFMRTLLDDADQATALATLGALGTSGGTLAGNVFHTSGAYVMGASSQFTTRSATNSVTPNFQVLSTGANASMMIARFGNDANHGRFFFAKSRGSTVGTYGAVQANDFLGEFSFGGSDSTKICEGAMIRVQAQEAPGTNYTPTAVSFYTANTGGSSAPTEKFRLDHLNVVSLPAGILSSGYTASVTTSYVGTAVIPQIQAHSASTAAMGIYRYGASASPPMLVMSKSRGAVGAHTAVNNGDQLGVLQFAASDGANYVQAARFVVTAAGTPNVGVGVAARLDYVVHNGTNEVLTFGCDQNGNFTMGGGSNIIVSVARHLRFRSYTVATLPLATVAASETIWCSDVGGGAQLLVSDGTNWARVAEGSDYFALTTAGGTVNSTVFGQASLVELTSTLTSSITYNLPTTGNYRGQRRRILRTGGGNFTCLVAGADINAVLNTNDWAEFYYTGSAWKLMARGIRSRKMVVFTTSSTFAAKDVSGIEVSIIEMDSASPVTLTVPNDTNASTTIGDMVEVFQAGAGQVTIAPDTGVTIQSPGGLTKTYAQYGSVYLRKRAANTWALTGGLGS